ncbi:hypothetical protein HPB50_025648 [Hyalomma asiaticum]|uniref:Uncharacterized protein n=1 Tax=Hyalomma asiaticum TaxID=266040 RepID=A0ACB7TNS3_HYAAI|nr:hypothetical protein HPB50_025648 [Hyalomma asiaticum]
MEAASWSIRDSKRDTTDDSGVEDSAATVAEVASWTRSASWARRSRVKSPAAARTRRVDCGKRCRKNSLNSAPFESTSLDRRSCRMLLSSWEGRRSPSSSLVSRCLRRALSDVVVRSRMLCLRRWYGASFKGAAITSATS